MRVAAQSTKNLLAERQGRVDGGGTGKGKEGRRNREGLGILLQGRVDGVVEARRGVRVRRWGGKRGEANGNKGKAKGGA